MGQRGPKPKSNVLRLLEGSAHKIKSKNEPACNLPAEKHAIVAADPVASTEWDRVVNAMPPGMYTRLDEGLLVVYALGFSMLKKAQQEIEAHGLTSRCGDGVKPNPAVQVFKSACDTLFKCADRLGLAPGVRARLELPTSAKPPASKFAGLLNGLDV